MQTLTTDRIYTVPVSELSAPGFEGALRNNRALGLLLGYYLPRLFDNVTHDDEVETNFYVDGQPVIARTRTENTMNVAQAKMKGAGRSYDHEECLNHLQEYRGTIIVKNMDDVLHIRLIPMNKVLPYVGNHGNIAKRGIDALFNNVQRLSSYVIISYMKRRYYTIKNFLRAMHDYPKGIICARCYHVNLWFDDCGWYDTVVGIICRKCWDIRGECTAER